jgi:mxaL protein
VIEFVYLYRLLKLHNLPLLLAILLLLVSVLMSPFSIEQPVYDVQITFDISQSMNVEDVKIDHVGVSRLGLAKSAARELLVSLPCGSRVGWGVFTGRRSMTLLTPLDVCLHFSGLLSSLDRIDGSMRWVDASSVGKGLHQSMRAAQSIGGNTTLVFISDGHEAPPLRQGQRGMPNTDRLQVSGLVAGVGGKRPAPIPRTDAEGRVIGFWQAQDVVQQSNLSTRQSREELSRLHDDHLIKLAQLANLAYVELDSPQALSDAVRGVGFSTIKSVPIDFRWLPASLALLALGWRFLPLS